MHDDNILAWDIRIQNKQIAQVASKIIITKTDKIVDAMGLTLLLATIDILTGCPVIIIVGGKIVDEKGKIFTEVRGKPLLFSAD